MRLMTDCDVITHSIVKQTWHITTKGEAAGNIQQWPVMNFKDRCTLSVLNEITSPKSITVQTAVS